MVAVLALLPLAACASIKEAVTTPQLTAVAYPPPSAPIRTPQIEARDDGPRPASANSLWRNGARAFFRDQRAAKVGDILTVQIDIDDRAKVSNQTSTARNAKVNVGVPNFLGLESSVSKFLPSAFDPAKAVGVNSDLSSDGSGSVNRSEAVSLTIAAVVSAVLPNGNLVIEGRQETRVNSELRELTVAGIVRPEDITSNNTIRHTQIAEARISYGGRGQVSTMQRTPVGQSLLAKFSPF